MPVPDMEKPGRAASQNSMFQKAQTRPKRNGAGFAPRRFKIPYRFTLQNILAQITVLEQAG